MNFGNLHKRNDLIADQVKFSEYMADKFLKKIPDRLELQDENRAEFELAVEGFLFFIVRGRDHLLQKINTNLTLGLKPRDVTLGTVREKLQERSSDNNAVKVLQLLDDCIQLLPCYCASTNLPNTGLGDTNTNNSPNNNERKKTWLTELAEIRNAIAHRHIIRKHVDVQLPSNSITSSMEVELCAKGKCLYKINEPDIRMYFERNYDKFAELHKNMNQIWGS